MKLNNTFILFDAGGVSKSDEWKKAYEAIENAVKGMSWPVGSTKGLVIPRKISIKKGESYTDINGKTRIWDKSKKLTLTQLPQFDWQVFCLQRRHVKVFTTILQTRGVQGLRGQVFAARLPDGQWGG